MTWVYFDQGTSFGANWFSCQPANHAAATFGGSGVCVFSTNDKLRAAATVPKAIRLVMDPNFISPISRVRNSKDCVVERVTCTPLWVGYRMRLGSDRMGRTWIGSNLLSHPFIWEIYVLAFTFKCHVKPISRWHWQIQKTTNWGLATTANYKTRTDSLVPRQLVGARQPSMTEFLHWLYKAHKCWQGMIREQRPSHIYLNSMCIQQQRQFQRDDQRQD